MLLKQSRHNPDDLSKLKVLIGSPANEKTYRVAADAALVAAKHGKDNAYKIELCKILLSVTNAYR